MKYIFDKMPYQIKSGENNMAVDSTYVITNMSHIRRIRLQDGTGLDGTGRDKEQDRTVQCRQAKELIRTST